MNAKLWSQRLSEARRDAALSAYTTALDWLERYPAHEVERRLTDIIAAKRDGALRTAERLEGK